MKNHKILSFALVLALLLAGRLLVPRPAHAAAKIYWTNYADTIYRADPDGSNEQNITPASGADYPLGIALDLAGGQMYWVNLNNNTLYRADLDGSNDQNITPTSGANYPFGIALDLAGGQMYWTNFAGSTIYRADLDGSNEQNITPTSGVNMPGGIALGDIPTAVELASFTAAPQGDAIQLAWQTATELDNLGFNLYRADAVDAQRVQLNAALIPAANPGGAVGATYSFVDEAAAPGVTYHYWLEDVDLGGATTLHGPVTAELQPLRRLLPARPRLAPLAPVLRHK